MRVCTRNLGRSALCLSIGLTLLSAATAAAAAVEDLLPDMTVDADALGEIQIDTGTIPGHRLLRLSAMTPNIGRGRMEVRADLTGVTNPALPSPVLQRIYRSDGSFWDRSAGTETFDADHGHVHFDDWAQYRLRTVNADGGVGAIVALSDKTSFCLLDLVAYDLTNPFIQIPPAYGSCGFLVQGITPGWADVYDLGLPDQWIDITGVADGQYWLEAEVDPDDRILEADETNNVSRILIQTGAPPAARPDRYEENDSIADVDQRPAGGPDSPNLGAITSPIVLDGLSMEDGGDYFKFHLDANAQGGVARIDSVYLGSDLDLVLLGAQGDILAASTSLGNFERLSLAGLTAGDYYLWIIGGDVPNPNYRLIVDPGTNQPPQITLTAPPAAGVWIELNFEAVPVSWIGSDPEGDPTIVSLAIDRDQIVDKGTLRLPAYQKLDGAAGSANVNTEGLGLGTWFLYAEMTDGRGLGTAWAPGPIHIYVKGDINFDGVVDAADWKIVSHGWESRRLPPGWEQILDLDRDGTVGRDDIAALHRLIFGPRASACAKAP